MIVWEYIKQRTEIEIWRFPGKAKGKKNKAIKTSHRIIQSMRIRDIRNKK
jgi:hypothetical protein